MSEGSGESMGAAMVGAAVIILIIGIIIGVGGWWLISWLIENITIIWG